MRKTSLFFVVAAALSGVVAVSDAVAGTPSGPYVMFQYCPYTNPNVASCVYSVTSSGTLSIGNTSLPITQPIVLQGGLADLGPGPLYDAVGAPTAS